MYYYEASCRDNPCPLRYTSGVLRKGELRHTWTSAPATTPAYQLPSYTFTGQYSHMDDPSTAAVTEGFGLMFYNARWYDPYLNHFTQPDTIVPDPYNSQDWNRYAYARNNPLKYTDPSGHRVDDGCSTSCSLSQYQKDQDAQKLALLEKESHQRKCRNGNNNYCVQMDEWAWDNIPSTIVIHKGVSGQAGFGGEFGTYREVAYAYNWRSWEADKLYVKGRYAYIGTPQLGALGYYKGVSFVYGASSISSLEGASSAGGFTASLDGGGTVSGTFAQSIAVNQDGVRLIDRGSGRPIQSHQLNVGVGVNIISNGADVAGVLADEYASTGTPTSGWDKFWYYLLSTLP
jgi:RHS repeat-associated protein